MSVAVQAQQLLLFEALLQPKIRSLQKLLINVNQEFWRQQYRLHNSPAQRPSCACPRTDTLGRPCVLPRIE